MNSPKTIFFVLSFIIYLSFNNLNAQTYCTPINMGGNNSFSISNFTFENINNNSTKSDNEYSYYNTISVPDVVIGSTYSASVTFEMTNFNEATVKVWIDFNNDGDFTDAGEQQFTYTGSQAQSNKGITETFQIVIPTTNVVATKTRMRVAIRRGNTINPCNLEYQVGEVEDYDINIKPIPAPPTANCVGSLDINLDVSGNATITAADVNNNSTDDYDDAGDLTLTLDRYTFNCDDLNSPQTVTLTVTDTDGLSATCTTTVNVNPNTDSFVAPNLPDITAFCAYSAEAPIMNYLCSQQIVGTTTDDTVFVYDDITPSNNIHTIVWTFDNGSTTDTATQTVTIKKPSTPTNVTITNTNETTAKVNWSSTETGPFRIRYRLNGTSNTWSEITSTTTSKTITGLDDGLQYEVQVKVDADCADLTTSVVFTTTQVQYCDTNVNVVKSNKYYISNVNIGNINNSSPANDAVYNYFNTTSTNLTVGEEFSGTITYSRSANNTTALVVWIDYNNDGDFLDAGEQVYSVTNAGNNNTVFNISLNNILVPETATLGKTRLRIGLRQNGTPTSACNFDFQNGEIEDYDVFLNEPDNSLFEAALITQVYHSGANERWIEVTNTSTTAIIPANTFYVALFQNKTGDQTGVTPDATFLVAEELSIGESVLIRNPSSIITSFSGTVIGNSALTSFDGANDIIAITKKINNTAWENRFDTVSSIPNNTSIVRNDEVITYNATYTASNWISFIDDSLSTTTNPPERHPHAPLISEVIAAENANANVRLGVHKINKTIRTGNAWSNGYPDRSRSVLISENVSLSQRLNARKLEVANSAKLLINNELLLVSNNIKINTSGEIRLAGTSQLVQTHTGAKNITGIGKLYIDQNSPVPSLYRYNYMSSPVSTLGLSDYTMVNVMKDGTTPTSISSSPKNINFIAGFDGSFANSPSGPIDISEYWIYTYDFNGSDYAYIKKASSGNINPGKGYLFKGPGRPQNYTYVGSPNDGSYSYNITGNKSILLGNPYASALNSKKFIEDNLDATTGTLYFWEHAGETNSSGNSGHNLGGYVGGYATRNISMGVSASNVGTNNNSSTALEYIIEAENGVLGGNTTKVNNTVLFEQPNDSLTFNKISISQSVDTLKVVYKSASSNTFDILVNKTLIKNATFPSSAAYETIKIPLQIQKNDTLLLKSMNSVATNIDKIYFSLKFEYTTPKQYIPIAQGFFVSGDSDGGTIIFNNSQRGFITEGDNSVFLKSNSIKEKINNKETSNSIQILKLGFNYKNSNNQSLHRQIGVSFSENNSFAYDKGYDSEMFDMDKTDIYWKFDNDERNYVICGVQEISDDLQVPLEILIDNTGEVSLEIDEWKSENKSVYLFDRVDDIFYLLNSEKAVLNLEKGIYKNRFYITFSKNKTLQTENILLEKINIFYNKQQKLIHINSDDTSVIKEAKLYNLLGQEINSWNFEKNSLKTIIGVINIKTSIYIVQLKTANGTISKKLLIN